MLDCRGLIPKPFTGPSLAIGTIGTGGRGGWGKDPRPVRAGGIGGAMRMQIYQRCEIISESAQ